MHVLWSGPTSEALHSASTQPPTQNPLLGLQLHPYLHPSHHNCILAPSQYQLRMGIFRKTLKLTTIGATATLGSFFYATRNCSFVPVDPATDPIFSWKPFRKLNPSRNPTVHDLCVRRVPLSEINPALLEKKGRLVEAFCAGVWSGWGMCRYNIYIYIYIRTLTPGYTNIRRMLMLNDRDRICCPARLFRPQIPIP